MKMMWYYLTKIFMVKQYLVKTCRRKLCSKHTYEGKSPKRTPAAMPPTALFISNSGSVLQDLTKT